MEQSDIAHLIEKAMQDPEPTTPNLALMERIVEMVQEHGQAIISVGIDDKTPVPFSYTVGLTLDEPPLPELAVYGLTPEVASFVLNYAADHLREEGIPLGHPLGGITTQPLYPVLMHDTDDLIIVRHILAEGEPVLAVQLVWPDPEGKYPWDGSVAAELQPLKGEWSG